MAGTSEGGRKAYLTRIKQDPDYFKKLGQKGGSAEYKGKKGFASLSEERRQEVSQLGGRSKRNVKKNKTK
jgi:general stress protein YciG